MELKYVHKLLKRADLSVLCIMKYSNQPEEML